MGLVAIAGVPPRDMSGKLAVMGGCGCSAALGDDPPTEDQRSALTWISIGLLGVAIVGLCLIDAQPVRLR